MKKKSNIIKPSKELQKAFDMFPKILKQKEKVAKEKEKVRQNFESVRHKIFTEE